MTVRSAVLASMTVNGHQTTPFLLYQPPAGVLAIVKWYTLSVATTDSQSTDVETWVAQVSDTIWRTGAHVGTIANGAVIHPLAFDGDRDGSVPLWLTMTHDHGIYGTWNVPVGSRLGVWISGAELAL